MQRTLAIILSGALFLAPALPALAADEAAKDAATPAPAATDAKTPDAAPAARGASAAPDLPDTKDDAVTDTPEDVTGTAAPDVPKEVLAVPGKVKVDAPEGRFKMRNFVLGFLGGAAVGAAAGVLFFSRNGNSGFDQATAEVAVPVAAGVGGLGMGLVAMLLGATTPEEAKPPKVDSELLVPAARGVQAGLNVRYDWSF